MDSKGVGEPRSCLLSEVLGHLPLLMTAVSDGWSSPPGHDCLRESKGCEEELAQTAGRAHTTKQSQSQRHKMLPGTGRLGRCSVSKSPSEVSWPILHLLTSGFYFGRHRVSPTLKAPFVF